MTASHTQFDAICPLFTKWWFGVCKPIFPPHDSLGQNTLLSKRFFYNYTDVALPTHHCNREMPWFDLFTFSTAKLLEASRLFAEILLSQTSIITPELDQVSAGDILWARSISSIQPLPRTLKIHKNQGFLTTVIGWCELGFWIKYYSEAYWYRLSSQFDPSIQESIAILNKNTQIHSTVKPSESDHKRARRCWLLAMHRAECQGAIH